MLNPAAEGNSSFSSITPGLQLGIDSTSLGAFKTCPRYYQLAIMEGWETRDEAVHLIFGLHFHRARETYDLRRSAGADHDEALDAALSEALVATWNPTLKRANFLGTSTKNRQTLIQSIVWYLDALGKDDPIETLLLANGRAAVELSFRFDSGLRTAAGETIMLCGHLDRIGMLSGVAYIVDIKTSEWDVRAQRWRDQFTPGNQFSLYALAGKVAFETPVAGVIADGVQVGVGFARFHRAPIPRPEPLLEEWLVDTALWIEEMERAAVRQYWPQNDKSCSLYGGCPFRSVCGRPPGAREQWLKSAFAKRMWDPLRARGDV